MNSLYDAHIHLADPSLKSELEAIRSTYCAIGLYGAVVVGSSTDDWTEVVKLAETNEDWRPAIGLHPWRVNEAPGDWQEQFLSFIDQGVQIIGEIGLDQWVEGHDILCQQEAFCWQLKIAAERNLPTSIHCLKAHEPLLQTLREVDLPDRGFKLHAYNGPVDTMKLLLELGAYFSFNAGQLKPNAKRVRDLIRLVPDDRILIETDAPDFLPPAELREFQLNVAATAYDKLMRGTDSRPPQNHPGNIRAGYQAVAEVRGQSFEALRKNAALNFERYFGN